MKRKENIAYPANDPPIHGISAGVNAGALPALEFVVGGGGEGSLMIAK